LFICDITDHLPVFVIYDCNVSKTKEICNVGCKRLLTQDAINSFNDDLRVQDWSSVHGETDTDKAYNIFLEIFTYSYDKYCPVSVYSKCNKYFNCPWMTKGLQNACKKKNNLYKVFIKLKTKEAENRYKLYKNKLTDVLRIAKKCYYKKLLIDNKTSIKGTWEVLNSIIKKGLKKTTYPEYFVDAHGEHLTKNRVVNSFNDFFVNIGRDLASSIPDEQTNEEAIKKFVSYAANKTNNVKANKELKKAIKNL